MPVCFLNEKLLLVIEFQVIEMLQDKHSILHHTWQSLTWTICPTCFVLKSQNSQQPMEFVKTDCDFSKSEIKMNHFEGRLPGQEVILLCLLISLLIQSMEGEI